MGLQNCAEGASKKSFRFPTIDVRIVFLLQEISFLASMGTNILPKKHLPKKQFTVFAEKAVRVTLIRYRTSNFNLYCIYKGVKKSFYFRVKAVPISKNLVY